MLDLGATVHRLWVSGGDGVRRNVVLGHATPQEHLDSVDYIGGTIGRFANGIRHGRFPLEGRTVQLETNERGNTLHGGPEGFDRRMWRVVEHADDQLTLSLRSHSGDQGFPGELLARVRFETTEDCVRLSFEATTDAPTVVNLTSHVYFNLDGEDAGRVEDQLLRVAADAFLPTDTAGLPLDPEPVAGTPYDHRDPTPLAVAISTIGGLDHNYLLDGSGWRSAAVLDSIATGTRLELSSDQPGLQVYTGNGLDGSRRSTTGRPLGRWAGVALEPQLFPDSPNRAEFGSAVLPPGATYRARLEWRLLPLPVAPGA